MPLDLSMKNETNSSISRGFIKSKLLGGYSLVICHKMSMGHKVSFEAFAVAVQDLKHNIKLMGCTTVWFAGNVREFFSVVQREQELMR